MSDSQRTALVIFASFLAMSLVASMWLGARAAFWLGLPALIMFAWATVGHLATIDEEFPGGWSNPDGSTHLWYRSLGELTLKCLVAALVAWLVLAAPLAQHVAEPIPKTSPINP